MRQSPHMVDAIRIGDRAADYGAIRPRQQLAQQIGKMGEIADRNRGEVDITGQIIAGDCAIGA